MQDFAPTAKISTKVAGANLCSPCIVVRDLTICRLALGGK